MRNPFLSSLIKFDQVLLISEKFILVGDKSGRKQQKADRRFNSLKAIKNDQAKVITRRRACALLALKRPNKNDNFSFNENRVGFLSNKGHVIIH